MSNPNFAEVQLVAKYGPDADHYVTTKIEPALWRYSDEAEQIWYHDFDGLVGRFLDLSIYQDVQMVVIQSLDSGNAQGVIYNYFDEVTAANVIGLIPVGEILTINRPDPATGVMLYCESEEDYSDCHIVVYGDFFGA
jgi:hypothetical protein